MIVVTKNQDPGIPTPEVPTKEDLHVCRITCSPLEKRIQNPEPEDFSAKITSSTAIFERRRIDDRVFHSSKRSAMSRSQLFLTKSHFGKSCPLFVHRSLVNALHRSYNRRLDSTS